MRFCIDHLSMLNRSRIGYEMSKTDFCLVFIFQVDKVMLFYSKRVIEILFFKITHFYYNYIMFSAGMSY
jgi:hypothetical protein